jgi:hypothetical protein
MRHWSRDESDESKCWQQWREKEQHGRRVTEWSRHTVSLGTCRWSGANVENLRTMGAYDDAGNTD